MGKVNMKPSNRRNRAMDYYQANPTATMSEVARSTGCSMTTVQQARKKLGLVRHKPQTISEKYYEAGKKDIMERFKKAPEPEQTINEVELRKAVELAGSWEELLKTLTAYRLPEIWQQVEKAGGYNAVITTLQNFKALADEYKDWSKVLKA